jgi:hypothetical protein
MQSKNEMQPFGEDRFFALNYMKPLFFPLKQEIDMNFLQGYKKEKISFFFFL